MELKRFEIIAIAALIGIIARTEEQEGEGEEGAYIQERVDDALVYAEALEQEFYWRNNPSKNDTCWGKEK
jgi:hypothetical protein